MRICIVGAGAQGSAIALISTRIREVDEVICPDLNSDRAKRVAEILRSDKVVMNIWRTSTDRLFKTNEQRKTVSNSGRSSGKTREIVAFGGATVTYWTDNIKNRWRLASSASGHATQVLLDIKATKDLLCYECGENILKGEYYVACMPMAARAVYRYHTRCWESFAPSQPELFRGSWYQRHCYSGR